MEWHNAFRISSQFRGRHWETPDTEFCVSTVIMCKQKGDLFAIVMVTKGQIQSIQNVHVTCKFRARSWRCFNWWKLVAANVTDQVPTAPPVGLKTTISGAAWMTYKQRQGQAGYLLKMLNIMGVTRVSRVLQKQVAVGITFSWLFAEVIVTSAAYIVQRDSFQKTLVAFSIDSRNRFTKKSQIYQWMFQRGWGGGEGRVVLGRTGGVWGKGRGWGFEEGGGGVWGKEEEFEGGVGSLREGWVGVSNYVGRSIQTQSAKGTGKKLHKSIKNVG